MSALNFQRFLENWFDQLHNLTEQLAGGDSLTSQLIERFVAHCSEFYRVKSLAAETDVLIHFSAPWATSLERSLHWVAGFRPTTIFHLIYTESSARFSSHIVEILRGRYTGDLGELTPGQLARVNELQCETVNAENEITERMSEWQDQLVGVDWAVVCCGGGVGEELESRIGRLRGVVEAADQLRMETIRKVVELLTPLQASEFVVAAAELLFGVRSWGLHLDRARGVV